MESSKKKSFGKGRSPSRFSFTYEDIAKALNCSIAAARKHAQRGNFDPNNLMSVLEFIQVKLTHGEGESLSSLVEQARLATGEEK